MYWLMVVKDHKTGARNLMPAMQVLLNRVKHGFWLLSAKNPYRKKVAAGDYGLFYVGSREGRFIAGECQINSAAQLLTPQIKTLIEGFPSTLLTHYIEIKGVLWANPLNAEEVIPNLSFVKNKDRWFAYLQGSLHPISKEDYGLVLNYYNKMQSDYIRR
ncbi:MAG: hypothetical protein QW555_02300 [Nitrososphaerota archaeon]